MTGWFAFQSTDIRSVSFPVSLEEIGECAFNNCKELSSISLKEGNNLQKIGSNAFLGSHCNISPSENTEDKSSQSDDDDNDSIASSVFKFLSQILK